LFEQKIILEAFSFFGVKGGGVATALFDGALRPPPLTRKKTTLVQSHLSQMLVDLYRIVNLICHAGTIFCVNPPNPVRYVRRKKRFSCLIPDSHGFERKTPIFCPLPHLAFFVFWA
jgi:hypothetical protein